MYSVYLSDIVHIVLDVHTSKVLLCWYITVITSMSTSMYFIQKFGRFEDLNFRAFNSLKDTVAIDELNFILASAHIMIEHRITAAITIAIPDCNRNCFQLQCLMSTKNGTGIFKKSQFRSSLVDKMSM